MSIILYFLELRLFFGTQEIGTPFPVTVEKLTGVWHCTPRYAKQIIRKLCELGWIKWQPGRGRGHTSVLTLLTDSDEILLQEAKHRMEQGDVKEAIELMNRFGGNAVKNRYVNWLSAGMGFSTKTVSDKLQDTLRFPVYRTIVTLDPGLIYYCLDSHIAGQVFNTLLTYDHDSRTIMPCIAHSWESGDDGREWMFHLKKGVMFHHGRELTAADVVFSLDRIRLQPDRYESSWMFQDIELVEEMDYKTVRIRLKEPNHLFLRFLSTIPSSIVPRDIVQKDEVGFGKKPVGTGPFRIVRFNEGICSLEAFPTHIQGRPQLDRVEVLMLPGMEPGRLKEPEWTSIMSSYGDTPKAQWKGSSRSDAEWHNMETLFSCCTLLVFNQRKVGPQNHTSFREALHHIIDREQMIADLGGDRFSPAQGFRADMMGSAQTTGANTRLGRREITALLHASGYQGETFRLTTTKYHETDAAWIRERCKSFGIDMEVDIREPSHLAIHHSSPDYDCQLYGNVFVDDEICELEMYLQKNYFLSAFDQQTAEAVTKATESIFRESDELERHRKLTRLEHLIRQTYSILYLVHRKKSTSFHRSVRGVTINSSGWLNFHKIWFHPRMVREECDISH
ncbi:SgrR family transcriptional regulator [Brevibacillus humidisoli]|uniref:SgrR family transcriptional regulator n=1 Tax=Brevibacillus humidisoli TaxID=2895522 RepID=UPI001E61B338|nr:SgrR family transcriptional regulator [Brevibacillus humidisoli]UFJ40346.1 SgrR family transcriptional regulator [Brevibacillus humidisoli]